MQQLAKTILRNSAIGMLAQIAIKIISFSFNILVIRNLGAADYGQYAAVAGFGSVFLFIADLGLSPYTVRAVARLRDQPDGHAQIRRLYGDVLTLRLILATIAGLITVATAALTGRPGVMVIAIAVNSLTILLYAFQGSSDAVLAGHERLDLSSSIKVVAQLIFVFLGALALSLGMGYYGLIVATMASTLFLTIACWRTVHGLGVPPARAVMRHWPGLLKAAFPFGVIGLTLGLSYRFDTVLLNINWGDIPTGHYNAAYNLIFSLVTISNVINTALYPSLSRQAATAPNTLPSVYERMLRYLLLVSAPITVGGFILARPLVELLFGVEYSPSASLLSVLIWALPLMFLSEFLGYVVVIADRESKVARAIFVSTSVNVLANLTLIPRFGPTSAAIITVVTEVVLVAQYLWLLRDFLAQIRWDRVLLRPLVAVAVMGLVVTLIQILPLPLTIFLGAVVYLTILLVLRVIEPDELAFLRRLRIAHRPSTPESSQV